MLRGQGLVHAVKHGKAWLQIVGGIGEKPEPASCTASRSWRDSGRKKLRVIVPRACSSIGQSNNHHSNKGPQGVSAKNNVRILGAEDMKVK
jgi:hypothetical protein